MSPPSPDEDVLRVAASSGKADALFQLGRFLYLRPMPERLATLEEGIRLMVEAAHQGHGEAAHLTALMMASDETIPDHWEYALAYLGRAAKAGHALAQKQFAFLGNDPAVAEGLEHGKRYDDATWYRLHDAIDIGALTTAPSSRAISASPDVAVADGIATSATCDWIIARAAPSLERARMYNPADGGGSIGQARTNSETQFPFDDLDLVILALRQRIANLTSLAMRGMEAPTVLHYTPGQEFRPHFDFLDPAVPAYAEEIARLGQRVKTVLVYLNDDFDGGETHFVTPNLRARGRKGDAVLFSNTDANGAPDRSTRHAGLPTTRGEKWLFSQWLRG